VQRDGREQCAGDRRPRVERDHARGEHRVNGDPPEPEAP
jgi:hypothetical protein